MFKLKNKGVGLNLRLETIDEIIKQKPAIDFLEIIVENWFSDGPHQKKLESLRKDYNLSFHCVGMNIAGLQELNLEHIKKVRELKDKFQPIHVSDHLCMTAHQGIQHHDLLPIPFNRDFLKNTSERVLQIQEILEEEILLENLSYYIEYRKSEMTEIDFFNEVMEKTNSRMLFDLNNLWVNSKNLNLNIENEIKKINWERVGEVHLAGPELRKGVFVDTHGSSIHSEVLELLENLKNRFGTFPVIYERDANLTNLDSLLNELNRVKEILC